MVELNSFDIDVLKSLGGFDRLLAKREYVLWRDGERKKERVAHYNARYRFYRECHPDVIKAIKERYLLTQKRKKYIRCWFLMVDNYIKG